ncbi:MAG: DUF6478 family protein [Paracoccus sp. (in: a-proteobacteria)]|nr:DUF6478 family protein [Paracoccus sp. (in: a-proteobacteria)]
MARQKDSWLSARIRRRAARYWEDMLHGLRHSPDPLPARVADETRALRDILAEVVVVSAAKMPSARNALSRMVLPQGTDWRWRPEVLHSRIARQAIVGPESGMTLVPGVSLFHDCPDRAVILRQRRNGAATDTTPFGLMVEVMGFRGSYLSCSFDLPAQALDRLSTHHVLRLDMVADAERPLAVYARLNVQQGPNIEPVLHKIGDDLAGQDNRRVAEFDLGYAELSARVIDKVWLDLILERPAMSALTLRDLVLSRHPRAQM